MKKTIITLVLLMTIILANPVIALANDTIEEGLPFQVSAILPENQRSDVSYFDIELAPKEEQTLEVLVTNTTDQPIRVNIEANPGVTNSNGLITYDKSIETDSKTEFVSFSEITQLNDTEIELAANSQETIELAIKTPETSFPGEILGGLYFELEQEAEASDQGVSISNKFAYVIGVVITDTTQQTPVAAQVSLESVETAVFNYRPAVIVKFANQSPTLVKDLVVESKIFAKEKLEVLAERTMMPFSIAPSNAFEFPIYLENGYLEPGDYQVEITMQNQDTNWAFEADFTVAAD